jgi:hypothetical protein
LPNNQETSYKISPSKLSSKKKTKAQINMALHMEEKKRELLAERKREGRESSKNDHLLI